MHNYFLCQLSNAAWWTIPKLIAHHNRNHIPLSVGLLAILLVSWELHSLSWSRLHMSRDWARWKAGSCFSHCIVGCSVKNYILEVCIFVRNTTQVCQNSLHSKNKQETELKFMLSSDLLWVALCLLPPTNVEVSFWCLRRWLYLEIRSL